MTPITAAIARQVVVAEISISQRTRARMRAAAGSSGASISADGLLMAVTQRRSKLVVAAEEAGERLDRVLAQRLAELSRSRHKALILAGRVVIDKPAGLVVHPAAGNWSGTLANALLAHCGESLAGVGGVKRPGIVHRLDKDTSGLLVVAKTDRAHRALSRQF